MYGSKRRSVVEIQALRREAGRWLRARRGELGLTQTQLALRLGSDNYTFISQLEVGLTRIPTDRYRDWASALELPAKTFATEIIRFYDPELHAIFFDGDSRKSSAVESSERHASPVQPEARGRARRVDTGEIDASGVPVRSRAPRKG